MAEKIGIKINEKTKDILVENYMTSIPGFFACGNIICAEDMFKNTEVDNFICGEKVSKYIKDNL